MAQAWAETSRLLIKHIHKSALVVIGDIFSDLYDWYTIVVVSYKVSFKLPLF